VSKSSLFISGLIMIVFSFIGPELNPESSGAIVLIAMAIATWVHEASNG